MKKLWFVAGLAMFGLSGCYPLPYGVIDDGGYHRHEDHHRHDDGRGDGRDGGQRGGHDGYRGGDD